MASGLQSTSDVIEPTRVWTEEEWNAWNLEEPGEPHREFRKRDFFARSYGGSLAQQA